MSNLKGGRVQTLTQLLKEDHNFAIKSSLRVEVMWLGKKGRSGKSFEVRSNFPKMEVQKFRKFWSISVPDLVNDRGSLLKTRK